MTEVHQRYSSIDAARTAAIFAVICIHTKPFDSALLIQACRFAVPFFFIASGFFFGKQLEKGTPPATLFLRYFNRLGLVFLVWSLIYVLTPSPAAVNTGGLFKAIFWNMYSAFKLATAHPLTFIFQGTSFHLWFITALLSGLGAFAALYRFREGYLLYLFALVLFLVGLLGGAYSALPIGYATEGFNTRNGPFISLLCIVLGWHLARGTWRPQLGFALGIASLGFALVQIEPIYLSMIGTAPDSSAMLIGDVLYGAGVFLLAMARPDFSRSTPLPWLGKKTLGIYVSHILFVSWLLPLRSLDSPAVEIALPCLVYTLSLITTLILAKWPFTARLVV